MTLEIKMSFKRSLAGIVTAGLLAANVFGVGRVEKESDYVYGIVVAEGKPIMYGNGFLSYPIQVKIESGIYTISVREDSSVSGHKPVDALELAITPQKTRVKIKKSTFEKFSDDKIGQISSNNIFIVE